MRLLRAILIGGAVINGYIAVWSHTHGNTLEATYWMAFAAATLAMAILLREVTDA